MASSRLRSRRSWRFRIVGLVGFVVWLWPVVAVAQQPSEGFALERLYLSAPGAGWFVMDDLRMDGKLGGAIEVNSGYARNPLKLSSGVPLSPVSSEAFLDVSAALTHERYRFYLNLPMPLWLSGTSGVVNGYQFNAPMVSLGTNPDTVADPRFGVDVRFYGHPDSLLRLGGSAQVIAPSGDRADYVSDARYRGMLRFLAAADADKFSYASQIGVHLRSLNDPAPGSPKGNELLFGVSGGRRFKAGTGWNVIAGPEVFGETAMSSFSRLTTSAEALITGRLEQSEGVKRFRMKMGIGHGLVQHFGAPEWRMVFGVEVFGQYPHSN